MSFEDMFRPFMDEYLREVDKKAYEHVVNYSYTLKDVYDELKDDHDPFSLITDFIRFVLEKLNIAYDSEMWDAAEKLINEYGVLGRIVERMKELLMERNAALLIFNQIKTWGPCLDIQVMDDAIFLKRIHRCEESSRDNWLFAYWNYALEEGWIIRLGEKERKGYSNFFEWIDDLFKIFDET